MALIDIRDGTANNITQIKFADDYALEGNDTTQVISVIRLSDGQTRPIALKTDIDHLILALQAAKRIW